MTVQAVHPKMLAGLWKAEHLPPTSPPAATGVTRRQPFSVPGHPTVCGKLFLAQNSCVLPLLVQAANLLK